MTFVRSLLFVALFYLWSTVIALGMIPLFALPRRAVLGGLTLYGHGISILLAVCGIRVERRGPQNMPTGPALIACKHLCMFDIFGQFKWLPASCFVMKKELMWIPWFGWYALKVKSIVVDREAG